MGLTSEMKNLSEEILSSFKQRIKETEERVQQNGEFVNEVQKTLDGIRKDHQEMAAVLNADAAALRKGIAVGEKERLNTYNEIMTGIHSTIDTIQKEVVAIQTSTFNMINEFTSDRAQMAVDLGKFFAENRDSLAQNEIIRIKEFDAMMNNINNDLKSINNEVLGIFKSTNDMLENFEKEHQGMSAELRAELSKNLAERVAYTKSLLLGFQQRLEEIGSENQELAKKMRKELASSQKTIANGEVERLNDYKVVMNGIHDTIKTIRKDVKDIQKATSTMIGDYAQDRSQASAEWNKMQDTIAQLKEKGFVEPANEVKKAEKKEAKKEAPVEKAMETPVEAKPIEKVMETPINVQPAKKVEEAPVKAEPKPVVPMTLEEKTLDYINKHPTGVKVSEMEKPLGETRMKLGYLAKTLLDAGKVQKVENVYFPKK